VVRNKVSKTNALYDYVPTPERNRRLQCVLSFFLIFVICFNTSFILVSGISFLSFFVLL